MKHGTGNKASCNRLLLLVAVTVPFVNSTLMTSLDRRPVQMRDLVVEADPLISRLLRQMMANNADRYELAGLFESVGQPPVNGYIFHPDRNVHLSRERLLNGQIGSKLIINYINRLSRRHLLRVKSVQNDDVEQPHSGGGLQGRLSWKTLVDGSQPKPAEPQSSVQELHEGSLRVPGKQRRTVNNDNTSNSNRSTSIATQSTGRSQRRFGEYTAAGAVLEAYERLLSLKNNEVLSDGPETANADQINRDSYLSDNPVRFIG